MSWCQSFGPSYIIYNVTKGVSQPQHIIRYSNTKKFGNDAYLTIYKLRLLSYVVVVDAQSGEHFWVEVGHRMSDIIRPVISLESKKSIINLFTPYLCFSG